MPSSDWERFRTYLLLGDRATLASGDAQASEQAFPQRPFQQLVQPPDVIVAGARLVRDLNRHYGHVLAMPAITVDPLKKPDDYLEVLDRVLADGAGTSAATHDGEEPDSVLREHA